MKQLFLTAFFVLALAGCGSKGDVVIQDGEGNKVEVKDGQTQVTSTDEKGGTVKTNVEPDGKMTTESSNGDKSSVGVSIPESEFGVPYYPGSTHGASSPIKTETGAEINFAAMTTTKDDPATVIKFYESKVTEPKKSSASSDGMVMESVSGKLADGSEVAIAATKAKDATETQITLTVRRTKK